MTDQSTRVKLKGDSAHSAHTIAIRPDGTLVAELYDFSDGARQACGGDIAFGVTVAKESFPQVLSALHAEPMFHAVITNAAPEEQMRQLLPVLADRFEHYPAFKSWLEKQGIPFSKYTDPFA